jgi:hypothetical protein
MHATVNACIWIIGEERGKSVGKSEQAMLAFGGEEERGESVGKSEQVLLDLEERRRRGGKCGDE